MLSRGWIPVPSCRPRMLPAGTFSPPNTFTPRRCAFESRPLRDEPCPFLCAMRNLRLGRGSLRDAGDLHLGVRLAVPAPPRPAFLLLAEVEHLPKPVLGDDLPRHLHALHQRLTHLRALRAAEQEHLVESDVAAHVASDLLDPEDVALGDPVLLSAGTNDCVHPKPLCPKGRPSTREGQDRQ